MNETEQLIINNLEKDIIKLQNLVNFFYEHYQEKVKELLEKQKLLNSLLTKEQAGK